MFSRRVERAAIVRLCLILLVVFIWLFSVPAHAQSQPQVDLTAKKVLIVNSFENNQPAFVGIRQGALERAAVRRDTHPEPVF